MPNRHHILGGLAAAVLTAGLIGVPAQAATAAAQGDAASARTTHPAHKNPAHKNPAKHKVVKRQHGKENRKGVTTIDARKGFAADLSA